MDREYEVILGALKNMMKDGQLILTAVGISL